MTQPCAEGETQPRRRSRKSAEPAASPAPEAGPESPPKSDASLAAETDDAPHPSAERAEEMLDQTGERLGRIAASFGVELRRSLSRAKEEAEDIWAEARDMHRRA